jgi:hypothetical protein
VADDNRFNLGGVSLTNPDMAFNIGEAAGGIPKQVRGSVQQMKDKKDGAAVQVKYDSRKGETSVSGPPDVMNTLQEDLKAFQQVKGQYQRMVQENELKQAQIKAHPFANTLAQIAAGLAQTDTNPTVKGLGLAASRMNPTLPQLRQEQMAMLEGEHGVVQGEARLLESILQHQSAAEQRKASQLAVLEQKRTADEQRLNDKWMTVASRGAFNPQAFGAEYKHLYPEASKETVAAVSEGFSAMAAQVNRDKKEALAEQDRLKREAKQAEIDARLRARREELDIQHRNRMEEAKGKGASKGLTGQELAHFQEVEAASGMLQNLKDAFEAHTDLFNPAWKNPASALKRYAGKYFDEDIQNVTSLYAHAVPIMIKLLREGARGYAPQQRMWLEQKAPKMSDTPEQIEGKLKFIQSYIDSDRAGTAKAFLVNEALREGKMTPPEAAKMMAGSLGDALKARNPLTAAGPVDTPRPQRVKVSLDDINKVAGNK